MLKGNGLEYKRANFPVAIRAQGMHGKSVYISDRHIDTDFQGSGQLRFIGFCIR